MIKSQVKFQILNPHIRVFFSSTRMNNVQLQIIEGLTLDFILAHKSKGQRNTLTRRTKLTAKEDDGCLAYLEKSYQQREDFRVTYFAQKARGLWRLILR